MDGQSTDASVEDVLLHLERTLAGARAYNEANMVKQLSGLMVHMNDELTALRERVKEIEGDGADETFFDEETVGVDQDG